MLAACGDSEAEQDGSFAPLGEVCGVEGPMRLLELAPDQSLLYRPQRIGERIFYHVGRPPGFPNSHPLVPFEDKGLWWTTGLCGEAPARLPEQFRQFVEAPRWPGLALACDGVGNLLSLAPTGSPAPHEVFHGTGYSPSWSTEGAIARASPGSSQLVLHRYPDDPRSEVAEVVPLLEVVVDKLSNEPMIAVAGDEMLAFTPTRKLMHMDLDSGATTVLHTDVDGFAASPSGRYYLWASAVGPRNEEGRFPAVSMLHDRETGTGVSLGVLRWPLYGDALDWADRGFMMLYEDEQQIYSVPGLELATIPWGYAIDQSRLYRPWGPLADGRWILRDYRDGSLHYFDVATGMLAPMYSGLAQILGVGPEGALVLEVPPCCSTGRADDEGPVWLYPADGSQPRLVAERSTLFGWQPGPELLVTLLDLSWHSGASLTLVDTVSREQQRIDDHVFAMFLADDVDPDLIRYSVQDGERSGVWQVRLPP